MRVLPVATLLIAAAAPAALARQFDEGAAEPIRLHGGRVAAVGLERPREVDDTLWRWARERGGRLLVLDVEADAEGAEPARAPRGERPAEVAVAQARWLSGSRPGPALDPAALEQAGLVWIPDSDPEVLLEHLANRVWRDGLGALLARGGAVAGEGRAALVLGEDCLFQRSDRDQLLWTELPALGLIPGARVDRQLDLPETLEARPGQVRLLLPDAGAIVLAGRRLAATGEARACLPPGGGREPRSVALGTAPQDLVALSRSARQRAERPWPRAEVLRPDVPHGALMIVGGGGIGTPLAERFVELAGGPDAPVVYVPCTQQETLDSEPRMCGTLRSWGFNDVSWIHTKDRDAADTDETLLAPLRRARAIWFGGGRQWNLVDSWQHTEAHRLMNEVLARGGVIGGSSAGATIQGDYLCRGNPLGNRDIMSEGYEEGLGFLTGVAIDQHFAQRQRQSDMEELVARWPQLLGIGLDEGTALVVQGTLGEVLGAGEVWLYDARPGGPGASAPARLAAGGRYDLAARSALQEPEQQAQQNAAAASTDPWVVYPGGEGPGAGRHVVLIAGDEEYRSEEVLPMLGRILAFQHGFRCTVLFSSDPVSGVIDPENQTHIPGLEHLDEADLAVVFLRFRELPDEDMEHFVRFVEAGKPLVGIRTATHAFDYKRDRESPYFRYTWRGSDWEGGFGKQVLGETWVAHHGGHGSQSTRGVANEAAAEHPILRGLASVWGPTDVYAVRALPEDSTVLLWGQVLAGMQPDSPPVEGPKNEPMMPLVWTRELAREGGAPQRVVCSTIGAAQDFSSEGLRRVLVNACYWGLGLEEAIPELSDVELVGDWEPSPFGFGKQRRDVRPIDLAWPR